ncbi:MAG: adenylate/guanylate cyclase domain-containing protein [Exilispira sp.]
MNLEGLKKNKMLFPVLISLFVSIIIILLYYLFLPFDRSTVFDLFTDIKIPGSAPKEVKEGIEISQENPNVLPSIELIVVDSRSLQADKMGEWPFPRWMYIPVFESFIDSKGEPIPNGVVFDIAFLSRRALSSNEKFKEDEDKLLSSTIKKLGNVYMQFYLEAKKSNTTYSEDEIKYIKNNYSIPLNKAKYKGQPIDENLANYFNSLYWKELIPPYKEYIGCEKAYGSPSTVSLQDQIVRLFPLVYVFDDNIYFNQVFLYYLDRIGVSFRELEIDFGKQIFIPSKNIKIPIDIYGQIRMNYVGNAGSLFHGISIYDLYNPQQMDKETKEIYFKDKDIFIGVYTTGAARDYKPTPAGMMYGVEWLALAFNQLMTQSFYYELPYFYSILIILIMSILVTIVISRFSTLKSYLFIGIILFLYSFISFWFFKKNILIPFSSVILSIILSFIGLIAYRILTEEKEKKFIRNTFSNFVSKVIVDELLKHPEMIKLGGERKEITVLFSDIRSFTTLSEKYQPEEIVTILNNYLSRMTATIFKYEGTLDKYVGDEIMAFWNAPLPQEDHAILACLTAIEMMKELHSFNEQMPEEYRLNIGIGINTGDAIVGNMGSTSRMDYTLIGDTVNTGARLEGTNKIYNTNIIISEFTYEKVKDYFICRLLDKTRVKGKSRPVAIYELLDVKEDFNVDQLLRKYKKIKT